MTNCLHILIHCPVVVTSGVKVISILPAYVSYAGLLKVLGGGKVKSDKIQRFPLQHF